MSSVFTVVWFVPIVILPHYQGWGMHHLPAEVIVFLSVPRVGCFNLSDLGCLLCISGTIRSSSIGSHTLLLPASLLELAIVKRSRV
jgi:hypothetical protein